MSRENGKSLDRFLLLSIALSGIYACTSNVDRTEANLDYQGVTQTAIDSRSREFFVDSQGDSIFVKTFGEGSPLLVVHGGPGLDHTYFLPHLLSLANDHQVIFYDQRASGRSSIEVDSNTVSIDGFLLDIENIRSFFGLDKWTILGHSWGGYLALNYTIKYPINVDRLVLIDPMPASTELQEEAQLIEESRETAADSLAIALIMESPAFENGEIRAYESLFRALFANQFYDRSYSDSLIIGFQPTFLRGSNKLKYLAKDISAFDIHSQLETMEVPTLLIYGSHDPLSGNSAQAYARYIPNVQLVIIPHSGHFPFVEQKESFFKAVEKFLQHESL
jgi:proline iminopeptidase